MEAIAELNMDTRGQFMLLLFLSAPDLIRLKSPHEDRERRDSHRSDFLLEFSQELC